MMTMQPDLRGQWINQNGSALTITEVIDGRIQGAFESKKGRAAKGKTYDLVGIQNGEVISFVVNFSAGESNLHAMTSFSGRFATNQQGEDQIHTLWVLTREFEDEEQTKPTQPWNAFIVNSDVFTKSGAD